MNVFVEPSLRRIAPFLDPAGDTLIQNRPLSDWQQEAIATAGLNRIESYSPPCLVLPDNVFITGGALKSFAAQVKGRNATLVVKRSRFLENTQYVQPHLTLTEDGGRYDRIRFVSGDDTPPIDVVVDPEEEPLDFEVPRAYAGDKPVELSLVRHPVMELHHWCHILWCNQIAGGLEVRSTPKWLGVLRLIWAVIRARSFNKWRVLSKLNRIGRGCDIHPTAVVEGCTIGDGVTVGPGCRLLFSHIGANATIMPGANVELSVLGESSIVSQSCFLRFSVLYPEAVMSQMVMQQCVLGRRVITTTASWAMDLNFSQNIRVPLDGEMHSTGTRFIGSAFGHRCRIGTGFFLASGRMVPNDYFIIRDPGHVLRRVPIGHPEGHPLIVRDGALIPSE